MNINQSLRYILLGGIFLIPFISFIVANSMFFPFITGKNFVFRILVEILFASWFILALRNPSYRPTFSWIPISILAFIGIIALADIFGADPLKSFWSNFERMEGLVTLLHLGAYFFVASTVLNTQKLWTWFFNTSIAASVLMGIFGLFQLSGTFIINQGGVRLDGRLGNATYLAVYMLFHVFITIILLVRWRGGNFMRYLYGAIIALQLVILYYTATRGAILGLIGGIILSALLIIIFERERPALRKIGMGIFIGALLIVGGFFVVKDTQFVADSPVLSRFASISITEGAVNTRFIIWNMALEGVKERPILGWGQENFNLVFNKYYDPRLYAQEPWFDRVHNIVLDWMIAGGILGFLAYVSIPLALLYYLWFGKSHNLSTFDRSLFTGLLAGYGFNNLFVFDNIISYILFFSIAAYIYTVTRPPVSESSFFGKNIDSGIIDRLAIPLVIIVLIFSVYAINAKGILTATTLLKGLRQYDSGPIENIAYFKGALAYGSIGQQEIREQLAQGAIRVNTQEIDDSIKQEFFTLAVDELEKQIETAPDDARLELFLASVLDNYRQYDDASIHYKRALELSPDKQTIRFALGLNYLNRGENEKALELFRETVELEPNFEDAHIMFALAAVYAQDYALADQILLDQFGTVIVNNDRILRAYFDSGQLEKVRDIWKLRTEIEPNNFKYGVSLAAVHLQLEERELAILELERLIDIDAGFREQGEFLINEIRAGRNP